MTALLDAIENHVGRRNAAFDDGHCILEWHELARAVESTAAAIRSSGLSGRPVGLFMDNSMASAILVVSMIEAGVPIVPLPPYLDEAQRYSALEKAGACALVSSCVLDGSIVRFAAHDRAPGRASLPPGTAMISFSSGSSGDPKGVCLSTSQLVAVATAVCDYLGRDTAGRHLPVLPFGILLEQVAGLFASLIAGGTYLPVASTQVGLANPLRPNGTALLDAVRRHGATSLILVPEYLSALVAAMERNKERLPLLNLVAVGGASVSPALLARASAVGLPVRQGYGMTEAGSVITLQAGGDELDGNVGKSIGAHRLAIAADGEILIEGPLFLGLVGEPRAPGPFRTGDIGRLDEQGRLRIEGRKSNLIVTSLGRNISPEWIEGLLTAEAEIAQAMVRGDGEPTLEALIVPAGPAVDVGAAIDRVNGKLPGYARLGSFNLVPPFTPANGQLTQNGRLRRAVIDQAYPRQPELNQFFDRLVAATREEQARFAMTPQLVAGLTGQVSRADYIAYLTQAFHHVRHTVPLMREARARLAERGEQLLVQALDDYIEEETGHEDWILDDIAAAGGDKVATVLGAPAPETKAMVDHAYEVIRNGNPAAFFGMVFVLEGTSVAMASNGAAAVQRRLGLPRSAFRYLNSHGSLDQDHMKFFETLMNRIESVADQEAIVAMAKDMFRLFGGIFAGIELEGVRDAA